MRNQSAYHCPQNAFEFHDEIIVFVLEPVLLNKMGELSEMTLLLQYLAA
jgi:hypothetical protein